MFRRMLKLKRRPLNGNPELGPEPWLDYHIRSLRAAKVAIQNIGITASDLIKQERQQFAAHVSRFGTGPREQHIVKHVLLWRNVSWWREQQFWNDCGLGELYHEPRIGKIRRWEHFLPTGWYNNFLKPN